LQQRLFFTGYYAATFVMLGDLGSLFLNIDRDGRVFLCRTKPLNGPTVSRRSAVDRTALTVIRHRCFHRDLLTFAYLLYVAPVMRLLLILTCFALVASAAEPDVAAIRGDLHSAIKSRKTNDEAFAGKLEAWYAAFGQRIQIDGSREHTVYVFGLTLATVPEEDLSNTLRQMPGATDRTGILAYYLTRNNLTTLPFDRAQWLQKPVMGRTRYRMFKSFLAQHPPIGRSQDEIEAILGPADSSSADGFTYELGPDLSAFGIDRLWVEFTLKDGKVTEHRYHSD
jgi:hypothetical protein